MILGVVASAVLRILKLTTESGDVLLTESSAAIDMES